MRHAFLVIAHNNFGNLQRIVSMLDSERCDFFIHFDKKVKDAPIISADHSHIHYCHPRIDVRWGNVSQIKCELQLIEFAFSNGESYEYYHIISGTHLPIVGLEGFDDYFKRSPVAVFQPMETSEVEIDMKIRRWNFCTRTFKNPSATVERASQFIWRMGNAAQRILKIRKPHEGLLIKTCNWCSLSPNAVRYLIENKNRILKQYRWTFCGDEFFAASEIISIFGDKASLRYDYLYQRFRRESPDVLHESDLHKAVGYLWARKFED